jgi:hypothetical protein
MAIGTCSTSEKVPCSTYENARKFVFPIRNAELLIEVAFLCKRGERVHYGRILDLDSGHRVQVNGVRFVLWWGIHANRLL